MVHTTVKDNVFGSIGGDAFSNNTTINSNNTVNIYPSSRSSSTPISRHGRGYMPTSNTLLYGRDLDLDFIVEGLVWKPETPASKRARFALLGTGGMGKSSLALKVMRDPRLLAVYPEYDQLWFPCVQATSFSLFLDTIHSALDITSDTKNTLNDILNELRSSKPLLLLFDNFETPWNIVGARGEIAQFLRDVDAIPHIALFITMRATIAPCEEIIWTEMRIKPLDVEASRRLYIEIDTKAREDQKLSELLEMLGNMPLAVKLMARQGKSTGCTVEELMKSYSKIGTAMLGPSEGSDPQNSVSISISMSLDNSQIKLEPNAVVLLCRISLLPTGTSFQTLQIWWASDIPNLQNALQALLEASLLERRTTTYFVLPVIRSHVLDPSRFPSQVRTYMVTATCNFLKRHHCTTPGEPSYKEDMTERCIQEINLQALLLQTESTNDDVIQCHLVLAYHHFHTRARTEVIEHAVKLASDLDDPDFIGQVSHCYAMILSRLNQFGQALEQYKVAREAYLATSRRRDAAIMLLEISYMSTFLDLVTDEIPLIEQARLELETIHRPKFSHHQHFLHTWSSFGNRFKKGSSKKPKEEWETDDHWAMLIYLQRIGRAYYRQHKPSDAITHFIKARNLHIKLSSSGSLSALWLARAYRRLHQYDEAEKWGLLSLKEHKEIYDDDSFVLLILGQISISRGQYDQAIERSQDSSSMAKSRNDQRNTTLALIELGRAYMKKEETEDARASFMEALTRGGPVEGLQREMVVCRYYLDKLDDPLRVPTEEQRVALRVTEHGEDIAS
ncbi:hypothetical protein C8J56DRAFT_397504 [Mycena floridula]|nr:hypothetical protein C8J56DRAFT_397504 [Mycena floridula]